MKKYLIKIAAVVLTAALVFLCGCTPKQVKRTQTYLDLFDTVIEIVGYEQTEESFAANCEAVYALSLEYHRLCDIYHEYPGMNNACTLNKLAGKQPVEVDEKLFELLKFAKDMAKKTDNACNVAMGSVLSLWHDAREEGTSLPDADSLEQAAAHTDIDALILNEEDHTVQFADGSLRLDLGAVAKGYAAERVANLLIQNGESGYLLNFGGNVKAVGAKPDGTDWITGIEDSNGNGYTETVSIINEAVVTSGDYQRGYTVNGIWYHHIIDPDTLYPAEYFTSVTVICPDSGIADCLSTALFNMSFREGNALLTEFEDAKAIWVTKEGEKLYTDNF